MAESTQRRPLWRQKLGRRRLWLGVRSLGRRTRFRRFVTWKNWYNNAPMVRIRFQRAGKPGQAHYRLVVVDRAAKRDGRPIENLGFYNPRLEKDKLNVNEVRVKYWHGKGAIPSETVKTLLIASGAWQRITA